MNREDLEVNIVLEQDRQAIVKSSKNTDLVPLTTYNVSLSCIEHFLKISAKTNMSEPRY